MERIKADVERRDPSHRRPLSSCSMAPSACEPGDHALQRGIA